MDYSPPGSSVLGILQARILEYIAMPSSTEIFLTQESNRGLLRCRWILSQLSYQGSPILKLEECFRYVMAIPCPGHGRDFQRSFKFGRLVYLFRMMHIAQSSYYMHSRCHLFFSPHFDECMILIAFVFYHCAQTVWVWGLNPILSSLFRSWFTGDFSPITTSKHLSLLISSIHWAIFLLLWWGGKKMWYLISSAFPPVLFLT